MAEKGTVLVAASDRMITASYPPIEFEHRGQKIEKLSNRCIALTAGSALAHKELFRAVRSQIQAETEPPVSVIASVVKDTFVELRRQRAEALHLKPRGLTMQEFYGSLAKYPAPWAMSIDGELRQCKYDLYILLGGVDEGGAHIYRIFDPGVSECFDSIGFNAIGSGEMHAALSLISCSFAQDVPLKEAIFDVYSAKRNSEVAPGVGEGTDLAVVTDKGVHFLSATEIEQIETLRPSRTAKKSDRILGALAELVLPSLRETEEPRG